MVFFMFENFSQVAGELEELGVKFVTPEQLRYIENMYVTEAFKFQLDNMELDS